MALAADIDFSETIAAICDALGNGRDAEAAALAERDYPFRMPAHFVRHYTFAEEMGVFIRDGFVDRYSGQRLVFPGVLRLLHLRLPNQFPFQKNWKMTETHMVYWQLFPTIDHMVPLARGGTNTPENWMTTSMVRNSAKANWLLEELGWTLREPGDVTRWDGLTGWFRKEMQKDLLGVRDAYLHSWHLALGDVRLGST